MKRTNHNHYRGFYLFLVLFCPQAWGQSEVGKVVSLTGKVMARIEAKGQSSRKIPKVRFLKPADPVFREDVINTDSNGSVKILFQDQSIMDLGQSSLFKVEEFCSDGRFPLILELANAIIILLYQLKSCSYLVKLLCQ
jgi:hypothetical protein